jgi:hypothetical protein
LKLSSEVDRKLCLVSMSNIAGRDRRAKRLFRRGADGTIFAFAFGEDLADGVFASRDR